MDDYQVVLRIKKGSTKAKFTLFRKYSPLVSQTYYKHFQDLSALGIELEDFIQEAWINFEKCLEYIDLDKVEGETLSFSHVFSQFLKNVVRSLAKKKFYSGTKEDASLPQELDIDNLKHLLRSSISVEGEVEKRHILKQFNSFHQSLPPEQYQALSLYRKGFPKTKIAKQMGVSYSQTLKLFKGIKEKLQKFQEITNFY